MSHHRAKVDTEKLYKALKKLMEFVNFEGSVEERISTQLNAKNEDLNDEGDSDKTDGDEAEEDECDNTHSNTILATELDEAGEDEDDSGFDTDSTMDLDMGRGDEEEDYSSTGLEMDVEEEL
jgi:hypothetical protein